MHYRNLGSTILTGILSEKAYTSQATADCVWTYDAAERRKPALLRAETGATNANVVNRSTADVFGRRVRVELPPPILVSVSHSFGEPFRPCECVELIVRAIAVSGNAPSTDALVSGHI